MKRIITLITDFGLNDHYTGAMKGVIYSINPDAKIVDITHNIPRQDVFRGAFILRDAYCFFPKGTIHVVVVDPGVGSKRRSITVKADQNLFVGPDNGLFSFIYKESKSVKINEIANPKFFLPETSNTFHGRDIFAPVAAHLSLGVSMGELGNEVLDQVKLEIVDPEVYGDEIIGGVIYEDSFGNLITNIPARMIKSGSRICIDKWVIERVSKSYSEVQRGELLAIVGSSGHLEFSVNQGRASDLIRSKSSRVYIRRI